MHSWVPCILALQLLCAAAAPAGATLHPQAKQELPHHHNKHGHTPVAMQGSAFLIMYYVGAVESLMQRGVIQRGVTPLSGLSGGGYTAALLSLGMAAGDMKNFWLSVVAECGARFGSCVGHMDTVLAEKLEMVLPEDAHEQLRASNVGLGISQLDARRRSLEESATWVARDWKSKADVKAGLLSTCHIPCWTANTAYATFRGSPALDGAFAVGFEDLCPHGTASNHCIKVASYITGPLADRTCSTAPPYTCVPPCNRTHRPASDKVHELYRNLEHPSAWSIASVNQCPLEVAMGPFVPQDSVVPDIHPGKFNPLPLFRGTQVISCQWQAWALHPPQEHIGEFFEMTYNLGKKDAASWCDAHGYVSTQNPVNTRGMPAVPPVSHDSNAQPAMVPELGVTQAKEVEL